MSTRFLPSFAAPETEDVEVTCEGMDPNTATLTITLGKTSLDYVIPRNLLDLDKQSLIDQGLAPDIAFGVMAKGLKLYAHRSLDLGYGITAKVKGVLGDISE